MSDSFNTLSPFEILSVSIDSTNEEIKKAFRKEALKWHPDKHATSSKEEQTKAEIEFKKAAWAYEMLLKRTKETIPFTDYWKEWESLGASWTEFWQVAGDPPQVPEENLESIEAMWKLEDGKSEQEKKNRLKVEPILVNSVIPWNKYIHLQDMNNVKSGCGKNKPFVDFELNGKVACWKGSIVQLEVDAIVNAVDNFLSSDRGGINKSIHKAAGDDLKRECQLIGNTAPGYVVITKGYCLPAKYIIHACGPKTRRPRYLSLCYSRALDEAVKHNIRTIAFPCISTGANYPLENATNIALATVRSWLEEGDNRNKIDLIIFGMFQDTELRAYQKWMQWYFPDSDGYIEYDENPDNEYLLPLPIEAFFIN